MRLPPPSVAYRIASARRVPGFDRAGQQVARDDASRLAVNENNVKHLAARVHRHGAGLDLFFQRLVGPEQELLPRLAASVERPRDLHASEGPRIK